MSRSSRVALVTVALVFTQLPAEAQVPTDSARVSRRLWAAMRRLADAESRALAATNGKLDAKTPARVAPLTDERDIALESARMLLDSVATHAPWAAGEVSTLMKEFPASSMLLRTALQLSVRDGRTADALTLADRLLRGVPRDASLHAVRGAMLERSGRAAEARQSYVRSIELDPIDTTAYRALVRIQQADGTLAELLERVTRLARRDTDARPLAERRIELLHRLGRTAEAEAAAKALKEKP
jgi:Flp pilus assembly protein TadD